jgi:translation initiation factor IF-2
MNVTELARKLRVHPKMLLEILPEYGFDIGKKAIKIDNKVAQKIIKQWKYIKRDLEKKRVAELEERKIKEKEERKESGITVSLPDKIIVKELAVILEMPVTQLIGELMKSGILANQNQHIDYDTAAILSEELGFTVTKGEITETVDDSAQEDALEKALARGKNMDKRAPVVVVMGHVDHGKTSLLDTIRKTDITSGEAGGITQHIGAYQTHWKDPKTKAERALTFIDTPGHEAFTVMRSRGAKVADIAILVVAADDGVKPQTKEVIQIIKAAKIPFVVAINKIDKDNADVQRAKTELSQHGVIAEEWGGDATMVEISAKQQLHIDKLLDVLLLVADMNEESITADAGIAAAGTVIESHVDKGMGPVATVLVQSGTLKKNDPLVVNNEIYGKVRAMKDYKGETITEAGPSVPAQIIGFKVAPQVGDILDVESSATAKKIDVKSKRVEQKSAEQHGITQAKGDEGDENSGKKTLNLFIKADVLGSVEAIIGSLEKIEHEEVGVKIIGKGLGNITEDDVNKAEAGEGKLIGFNVKASPSAEAIINEKEVPLLQYSVIYDLINWVKEELEKLLDSEKIVTEQGNLKVLAIFRTDKGAMTIGGRVETGKIVPDSFARVKRDGEEIGLGKIVECQTGMQKVKKVPAGTECGVRFEGKLRIEECDVLEVYTEESKARKIVFKD